MMRKWEEWSGIIDMLSYKMLFGGRVSVSCRSCQERIESNDIKYSEEMLIGLKSEA